MRGCIRMALVAFTLAVVGTAADARPARRAPAVLKIAHLRARTPIESAVYSAVRYQQLADLYARRAQDQAWIAVCISERTDPTEGIDERAAQRDCEASLIVEHSLDGLADDERTMAYRLIELWGMYR